VPKLPLDFKANVFQYPHCGISTKHEWYNLAKGVISENGVSYYKGFIPDLYLSLCSQCNRYTLWLNEKIIYPPLSFAPWPTEDMPLDIKDAFLEARGVATSSPKAASALLRLCLQNLMAHLGESGKNLELDISNLIKKGLPQKFRDALWAVRAIGFDAVKPGKINLKDDVDTAVALFNLINMIVEATISQQKKVNQLYTTLPNPKRVRKKRRARKKKKTRKPKPKKEEEIVPRPTILYR
jgi:hypothetical protein